MMPITAINHGGPILSERIRRCPSSALARFIYSFRFCFCFCFCFCCWMVEAAFYLDIRSSLNILSRCFGVPWKMSQFRDAERYRGIVMESPPPKVAEAPWNWLDIWFSNGLREWLFPGFMAFRLRKRRVSVIDPAAVEDSLKKQNKTKHKKTPNGTIH